MALSRKKKIIIAVSAVVVLALIIIISVVASRKDEPEVTTVKLDGKSLLSRRDSVACALHVANKSLSGGKLRFLAGLQLRRIDPHQGLVLGYLVTWIDVNLQDAAGYFAGQFDIANRPHLTRRSYGRPQFGPHVQLDRSDFRFVFSTGNDADNNDQRQHDDC